MLRVYCILLAFGFLLSGASAQQALDKELVIGTKIAAPFAMKGENGEWTGLSIELWKKVAGRLNIKFRFAEEPDIKSLLLGVQSTKYDAAIAAITVTADRESVMEFSQPYYVSGLGIAVASAGPSMWGQIQHTLISFGFLQAVAILIAIAFLVGVLIWLFERRHNVEFGGSPIKGIGNSLWWSAEAMTQASTGYRGPKTMPGRMLAIVWMVVSIIAIAVFTAGVTSAITASKLQGLVNGPEDLPSVRVGAVAGTATVQYLALNGTKARTYASPDDGLKALSESKIDAFVYDRPLLGWFALHGKIQGTRVLDDNFDTQTYAVAFPINSPLRRQVDLAILEIIVSDWWKDTLFQYLGER
jgi:polar amino acid transport system substrate-binding protein